jgi:hypothetical protein
MSQTEREIWIARIERVLAELKKDHIAAPVATASTVASRDGERSR